MPSISDDSNEVKIERIREKFLQEYEKHNELYEEIDVQRVRENDWTIKRFLLSNKCNEELALKKLSETMEWRKSYGVTTRTDDYFPDDFYKIGGLFTYQCDRNGLPLLYFRVCVHRKDKDLIKYIKEYFVHNVNRIDTSSAHKWAIVFDVGRSGLSSVDMDFSRFMVNVLQNHFPKGYKYVLVYDMPWILSTFWKIIRAWISDEFRDSIKFANGSQIFNYIEPENVPKYIPGGKCDKSIFRIPEGVKSVEHLSHLNFTEEQIKRFRNKFGITSEDNEDIEK